MSSKIKQLCGAGALVLAVLAASHFLEIQPRNWRASLRDADIFRGGMDTDQDGLPDVWEVRYFGNLAQNAYGDFDGDGLSNGHECHPDFIFLTEKDILKNPRKKTVFKPCLFKNDSRWTDPRNWDTNKNKISDGDEFWGRRAQNNLLATTEPIQLENKDPEPVSLKENLPIFADISSNHKFHKQIATAKEKQIIPAEMTKKDEIHADQPITRAEFVALLVNARELPLVELSGQPFTDVSPRFWDARYIATAHQHKLIRYIPQNRAFRPNEKITRSEALEFIFTAFHLDPPTQTVSVSPFTDVGLGFWDTPYIVASANLNLLNGFADRTFRPRGHLTRAEALDLILRAAERETE